VLSRHRNLHGDIVVELTNNNCVAIGGNLGESVRRLRYPLSAQGHLIVDSGQLFTQEDNGRLPAVPVAARRESFQGRNTARIFALLSLVEAEAVVRG
jgi:hypothetical protein